MTQSDELINRTSSPNLFKRLINGVKDFAENYIEGPDDHYADDWYDEEKPKTRAMTKKTIATKSKPKKKSTKTTKSAKKTTKKTTRTYKKKSKPDTKETMLHQALAADNNFNQEEITAMSLSQNEELPRGNLTQQQYHQQEDLNDDVYEIVALNDNNSSEHNVTEHFVAIDDEQFDDVYDIDEEFLEDEQLEHGHPTHTNQNLAQGNSNAEVDYDDGWEWQWQLAKDEYNRANEQHLSQQKNEEEIEEWFEDEAEDARQQDADDDFYYDDGQDANLDELQFSDNEIDRELVYQTLVSAAREVICRSNDGEFEYEREFSEEDLPKLMAILLIAQKNQGVNGVEKRQRFFTDVKKIFNDEQHCTNLTYDAMLLSRTFLEYMVDHYPHFDTDALRMKSLATKENLTYFTKRFLDDIRDAEATGMYTDYVDCEQYVEQFSDLIANNPQ